MLPPVSFRPFRAVALSCFLLLALAAVASAATVQLSGPAGASVRLAGSDLGLMPLDAPLELSPGVYEIEAKKRGYESFKHILVVRDADQWVHVELRLLPLKRSNAVKGSLVYAGLGQFYSGAKFRGWIYFLGETGGLLTAIAGEMQRSNYAEDYTNFKAQYDISTTPSEIERFKHLADQSYADMESMEDLRNTGLMVAAGSYVLSLLDAWLLFPSVDIGPGMIAPTTSLAAPPTMAAGMHAAVTIDF